MTFKRRLVRVEPSPGGSAVALRALMGSAWLTREDVEDAARANYDRFGWSGVSVFVAEDEETERWLLRERFARSPRMAHFEVAEIRATGLDLLPTGTNPHHDVVVLAVERISWQRTCGVDGAAGPADGRASHCEGQPVPQSVRRLDVIHIDLPADRNFEDDDGFLLARIPAGGAPQPGSVVVAGTLLAWTWALVADIEDGWVRYSQISMDEAARHGSLVAP